MRILLSVLLTAALIGLVDSPAINNSTQPTQAFAEHMTQENTALSSRQGAQTQDYIKTGDGSKALATETAKGKETETGLKPKPVAATPPPIKAEKSRLPKQGCETYRSLVSKYDWDANVALAVMQAESGCNPSGPPSSTCDRGLMQINCVHADMVKSLDNLYDPATNISVAYKVYLGRKQKTGNGWQAWNAYKSGKHLKFL